MPVPLFQKLIKNIVAKFALRLKQLDELKLDIVGYGTALTLVQATDYLFSQSNFIGFLWIIELQFS